MSYNIINGDNIAVLKTYPDNYFDSIISDPPYGIEFLAKDWDKNTGAIETWEECLRVLKPGGYILAFSAPKTYHHLATNIESVGFEIRDQIMWLNGSGFPKAQDVGKAIQKRPGATSPDAKQWAGWKTALKPAHEPIVMARKPFKGSCIDNVLEHGVGAVNIDESRIPYEEDNRPEGRFPSNIIGEVEGYQKFFYCPKVGRKERHCGFEQLPDPEPFNNPGEMKKHPLWDPSIGTSFHRLTNKIRAHNAALGPQFQVPHGFDYRMASKHNADPKAQIKEVEAKQMGNHHPTVKPVALMKYLIKLVTPPNSKVLDPFVGSGSTGMAAMELEHEFTGIELDKHYCDIAEKRIEGWIKLKSLELFAWDS